jgi:hypothetical protein
MPSASIDALEAVPLGQLEQIGAILEGIHQAPPAMHRHDDSDASPTPLPFIPRFLNAPGPFFARGS